MRRKAIALIFSILLLTVIPVVEIPQAHALPEQTVPPEVYAPNYLRLVLTNVTIEGNDTIVPHLFDWYFDGQSGYLRFANPLSSYNAFSIELYFIRCGWSSSHAHNTLIRQGDYHGIYIWDASLANPAIIRYIVYDSTWRAMDGSKIEKNRWYHVCLAVESGVEYKAYLNGQYDTGFVPTSDVSGFTDDWGVGDNPAYPGRKFVGEIAYVRIYERKIKAAEVAELVSTKVINGSKLVLYLDATFYDGTQYIDISPTRTNASIIGEVHRVLSPNMSLILIKDLTADNKIHLMFFPAGTIIRFYDELGNKVKEVVMPFSEANPAGHVEDFIVDLTAGNYTVEALIAISHEISFEIVQPSNTTNVIEFSYLGPSHVGLAGATASIETCKISIIPTFFNVSTGTLINGTFEELKKRDSKFVRIETSPVGPPYEVNCTFEVDLHHYAIQRPWVRNITIIVTGNCSFVPDTDASISVWNISSGAYENIGDIASSTPITCIMKFDEPHMILTNDLKIKFYIYCSDSGAMFNVTIDEVEVIIEYEVPINITAPKYYLTSEFSIGTGELNLIIEFNVTVGSQFAGTVCKVKTNASIPYEVKSLYFNGTSLIPTANITLGTFQTVGILFAYKALKIDVFTTGLGFTNITVENNGSLSVTNLTISICDLPTTELVEIHPERISCKVLINGKEITPLNETGSCIVIRANITAFGKIQITISEVLPKIHVTVLPPVCEIVTFNITENVSATYILYSNVSGFQTLAFYCESQPTRLFHNGTEMTEVEPTEFATKTEPCWYYDENTQTLYVKVMFASAVNLTISWIPAAEEKEEVVAVAKETNYWKWLVIGIVILIAIAVTVYILRRRKRIKLLWVQPLGTHKIGKMCAHTSGST